VSEITDLHYAWGGRLCLHPFNLGFLIALSRESEIPNFSQSRLAAVRMHGNQAAL